MERGRQLATLRELLSAVAGGGHGRLALVYGEAGIGKTSLVRAFASGLGSVGVLWGACDALHTPRPLGPLVDVAAHTGGDLAASIARGASASDVLAGLAGELQRRSPTVLVLEDLHWADEATLDVLRLLGRRLDGLPVLVVATYRDDELERTHPLRVTLGELPRGGLERVALAPLSAAAVSVLAEPHRLDPVVLHRRTAGNPFFVTEALSTGEAEVPDSVRDAVLARAARLDERQRRLIDAVAVVPSQAELWLLEAMVGDDVGHLEGCLASGMLRVQPSAVSFRHEIARVAIEETLPPNRALALHRLALSALRTPPAGVVDLARVAHHAEAAGDPEAVLRYAPAAGEWAASHGAHREAAAQFARALRFADRLPTERRAELLERRSYECYLTDAIADAASARRQALAAHRARGDRRREGDAHRWLSRLAWFVGDNATAEAEGTAAVKLLETLPPGRELAMAYSNIAQLRMLAWDLAGAREWGGRAIELAERLGETEILAHALNNVGTAEFHWQLAQGVEKLERSLALARAADLEEHVARAHTNLAATAVAQREYALADRHLEAGISYSREHDLDSWRLYMTGWRARSALEQGRWDKATECAMVVLDHPNVAAPSRITPLIVIGRLRARRGDPDPWAPLNEAYELAAATGEPQRLVPVALARAETCWLDGEPQRLAGETEAALELALARRDAWGIGGLLAWRRRAGIAGEAGETAVAEPFRLELAGEFEAAATSWREVGCPYEAALALLGSDQERSLHESMDEFERLGARRTAARAAEVLRGRGIRGPRASTRGNPAGLTAREIDVLALLAGGLRNAQIAERLVVSTKTVDHHVSAILRKLGVSSRLEASVEAARLGLGSSRR